MPNPYMDALKKFNEGKTGWCVPRKGTADYQKVMGLMTKPASKPEKQCPVPAQGSVLSNAVDMGYDFSLTENK